MKLTLSISPCPNDTFMFEAIINRRIDLQGLEFDVQFADIEQLNASVLQAAQEGSGGPDVTKISYAVLPQVVDYYALVTSGSALGHGNGPILVAKKNTKIEDIKTVAVPGAHTTANLLVQRLLPHLNRHQMLFSDIAEVVEKGGFDAGILIHEGRFSYPRHSLRQIVDMGTMWEEQTKLPLPLGGIVVRRGLEADFEQKYGLKIVQKIENVIRKSVEFAMANPLISRELVRKYAQELDDDTINKHIALFVNDNSLALNDLARKAIEKLTGVKV